MKRAVKFFIIIFTAIIVLVLSSVIICYLYINKANNLNPEETIKKYMEYWVDDSTLGMKSLESKKADFIDVIRNSNSVSEIETLRIEDESEKEIDSMVEQYNGRFSKDDLKLYRISFNAVSDDDYWNGEHTFNIRLVHEKKGWCILSFGHI